MKRWPSILMGIALLALSACLGKKTICPVSSETPQYLAIPPAQLASATPPAETIPILMEIGGRTIPIDRVISGPLCNDSWSGTIYVTCDVQVYSWQDDPTFLKDCNLNIAPDTVVYVAYHNDAAYYKGCSCHTENNSNP
jgi:hypothetical protein